MIQKLKIWTVLKTKRLCSDFRWWWKETEYENEEEENDENNDARKTENKNSDMKLL